MALLTLLYFYLHSNTYPTCILIDKVLQLLYFSNSNFSTSPTPKEKYETWNIVDFPFIAHL